MAAAAGFVGSLADGLASSVAADGTLTARAALGAGTATTTGVPGFVIAGGFALFARSGAFDFAGAFRVALGARELWPLAEDRAQATG